LKINAADMINNATLNLFAYVGYSSITNTTVIAFRGTVFTSVINWVDNVDELFR